MPPPPDSQIPTTTTGEFFLPSRVVYRIVDEDLGEKQRELAPLERHRLDAYYEDGPEYLVVAMQLRELLAMKQHQSGTPVRPYEAIEEIMRNRGVPPGSS